MKFFSKKVPTQTDILKNQIIQTKIALDSAYSNFENVTDPTLIDCYIYELNSVQKRYEFLLKQVKQIME